MQTSYQLSLQKVLSIMEKYIIILLCFLSGTKALYPKCDILDVQYEIHCMCHRKMPVRNISLPNFTLLCTTTSSLNKQKCIMKIFGLSIHKIKRPLHLTGSPNSNLVCFNLVNFSI